MSRHPCRSRRATLTEGWIFGANHAGKYAPRETSPGHVDVQSTMQRPQWVDSLWAVGTPYFCQMPKDGQNKNCLSASTESLNRWVGAICVQTEDDLEWSGNPLVVTLEADRDPLTREFGVQRYRAMMCLAARTFSIDGAFRSITNHLSLRHDSSRCRQPSTRQNPPHLITRLSSDARKPIRIATKHSRSPASSKQNEPPVLEAEVLVAITSQFVLRSPTLLVISCPRMPRSNHRSLTDVSCLAASAGVGGWIHA